MIDHDDQAGRNIVSVNPVELSSSQHRQSSNSPEQTIPRQSVTPNYHDNQRDYHDSLSRQLNTRASPALGDNYSRLRKAYPDHDNIFQKANQADNVLRNRSVVDSHGQKLSLQQRIQLINSQHPPVRNSKPTGTDPDLRRPPGEVPAGPAKRSGMELLRTPNAMRPTVDAYSVVVSEQQLPGINSRARGNLSITDR